MSINSISSKANEGKNENAERWTPHDKAIGGGAFFPPRDERGREAA